MKQLALALAITLGALAVTACSDGSQVQKDGTAFIAKCRANPADPACKDFHDSTAN